jgi:hypothetical protein
MGRFGRQTANRPSAASDPDVRVLRPASPATGTANHSEPTPVGIAPTTRITPHGATMKKTALTVLLALASPLAAAATDCESAFSTEGDPRNGAEFTTSARLDRTSPASALGQLQALAAADGFRVLGEDLAAGTLTIEQSKGVRPFLIEWRAQPAGAATIVSVRTRLNRGATARADDIRAGMCGMIARIKPGSEGEAVAATARAGSSRNQVVAIKATALAEELGKARRTVAPAVLEGRYRGRRYTVDGQVSAPVDSGNGLQVWFDTYQGNGNALFGQSRDQRNSRVWPVVVCVMASAHEARALKLVERDWATLTGTVSQYVAGAPDKLMLRECQFQR